jgi:hypothetical protein
MTSRERIENTLSGGPVDRIATFDIFHNIPLIEYLAGEPLNPQNGEDLLCKAATQKLDIIRHFAVPDRINPWYITDDQGFTYEYQWWTAHVVERPHFRTSSDVAETIKRDIETIHKDMDAGKVSHIARQHVRLFDENFAYIDEVLEDFKRITAKLNGTMMLPPEDVASMGVAAERFDEQWWWYFYADYPELAGTYMDTLTDYQLHFIEKFACADVCPFTQISVPAGTRTGLLYPPEFFKEEVIPRERKKIDCWKKHGYYVLGFIDGYKWPLIDDFIDCGIDELHPCEPYCTMEVKPLREKYPDLCLGQPIDCTQLLAFGTPEQIGAAVEKAIEEAGGKRIFIGSTSEIHLEVPIKNALALYDTAQNFLAV